MPYFVMIGGEGLPTVWCWTVSRVWRCYLCGHRASFQYKDCLSKCSDCHFTGETKYLSSYGGCYCKDKTIPWPFTCIMGVIIHGESVFMLKRGPCVGISWTLPHLIMISYTGIIPCTDTLVSSLTVQKPVQWRSLKVFWKIEIFLENNQNMPAWISDMILL